MDQPVVGKFNKFPRTRWDQIPNALQQEHIDAVVAVSPENVAYTSGHSEDILHALRLVLKLAQGEREGGGSQHAARRAEHASHARNRGDLFWSQVQRRVLSRRLQDTHA